MPGSVSTAACLQRTWQFAPLVCRAGLDRKISPNRNRRPNHNPPRCIAALGLQLDEQIDLVENRNCDWKMSVPPSLQNLHHRLLDESIQHGRNAELTHSS